jgi:glycerol-3-phosphate acyltransferase PlsY
MNYLPAAGLIALSYLLGSVPFGLLIVRLSTGKDIRQVESGRTGGTNALRAAGFWAGFFTAILDFFKACVPAWVAISLFPDNPWVHVLAPVAAVLGHNYSIFLLERNEKGQPRLRGGAGGAPSGGGAMGLWFPSILIILPVGLAILYFVGYASVATMSVGIMAMVIFAVRAWQGVSPWQYIFYGVLIELLVIIALRPNIRRLLNGTERVVGFRAQLKRRKERQAAQGSPRQMPKSNQSSSSSSSSSS